jgi:hypothetical protein
MRNGRYSISFRADGYEASGVMEFKDGHGAGHETAYRITLDLVDSGPRCAGNVEVAMDPSAVRNTSIPREYSVPVTSSCDEDGFNVIGVGPLGIIVDLTGTARADH